MDHNNISDSVHSTEAFVVGVGNPDLPPCSGFWFWCVKRPLRKFVKNIFDLSLVIMCVPLNVYVFFYIRGNSVFSTAQFNLQLPQFPVCMELLNLRKRKLAELLKMDQYRAPWMANYLAIHGTVCYVQMLLYSFPTFIEMIIFLRQCLGLLP